VPSSSNAKEPLAEVQVGNADSSPQERLFPNQQSVNRKPIRLAPG